MPLFLQKKEDSFRIIIWKMEEEFEELLSNSLLSPSDLEKVKSFQSEHRKKEWLCVRMMVHQMTDILSPNPIIYDEHGKPHLENSHLKISISHTKDFVGVIISEKHHVGIDLERMHPRIEKITHKFLSVDEKSRIPSEDKLRYFYIIWGTKEVLYKIYGKEGILFSKNILTDPFEVKTKGILNASLNLDEIRPQQFELHYEFMDDLLLTYSVMQT